MASLPPADIPEGVAPPTVAAGSWNALYFAVQQLLSRVETAIPVTVLSCTNAGGVSPMGTVEVTPMVNVVDGQGVAIQSPIVIFNVPYCRLQGGSNAIIIDPVLGDKGLCVFASRDLTKIKNTREPGNPGSWRKFDLADAMYTGLGMFSAEAPTQYVRFAAGGITITSPTQVTLTAPTVVINGDLTINGNLDQIGDIALTGNMVATGTVHASNIP